MRSIGRRGGASCHCPLLFCCFCVYTPSAAFLFFEYTTFVGVVVSSGDYTPPLMSAVFFLLCGLLIVCGPVRSLAAALEFLDEAIFIIPLCFCCLILIDVGIFGGSSLTREQFICTYSNVFASFWEGWVWIGCWVDE